MREIEVKSTATQCQKCVKCINLRPDVCAMYEEYKSQALTPPAIFLMGDVILDKELEPTAERSITPFACTMCGACANACYSMFIHFVQQRQKLKNFRFYNCRMTDCFVLSL